MALINCPECKKEISDKAISCPNCGIPLNKLVVPYEGVLEKAKEHLVFPVLPLDLSIGKHITSFAGDTPFDGFYDQKENVITKIPIGKVSVVLYTHGIQIINGFNIYSIHNSQIISLIKTSKEELVKTDKSVIGRAVVGGFIMGPLGAIIGGMSGIGSKESIENKHYLVINFWDVDSKSAQTILISGDGWKIGAFILRQQKEQSLNSTQNRQPETDSISPIAVVSLLIVVICIIGIIILFVNR